MIDLYIFKNDNLCLNDILSTQIRKYLIDNHKDKNISSLNAYYHLNNLLREKYKLKELNFDFKSKPKLVNNNLYFNISHTEDLIVIAISNHEVGIDVENLNRKVRLNLANKILSIQEKEIFVVKNKSLKYLIECFVKKEAYLKYLKTGINTRLDQIDTINLKFYEYLYKDFLICIYPFDEEIKIFLM